MNESVIMLGTGSPRLNKDRIGSANLLIMNDLPILVDCAEGTTMQLVKSNIAPQDIKHVFITHLHADHMLGYANFLISGWVSGRQELTVVGPVGTKKMNDLVVEILKDDIDYKMSLGRTEHGIRDVKVIEIEEEGKVDVNLPFDIHCAEMNHSIKTFAYRFETEGKSVVFSGDTAPPTDKLAKLAEDTDILVHDTALTLLGGDPIPNAKKIWENLQREHCTPTQAAETAKKANVGKLVLTHFLPKMEPQQVLEEASAVFDGEIIVANDLDVIKLSSRTIV